MNLRLTVAAIAVAFCAQAASAADIIIVHGLAPSFGNETVHRQVGIKAGDVNPADAAGAAVLLARIRHAADVVCSGVARGNSEAMADRIAKCRTKAVAQAVRDVDTPAMNAAASAL